MLSKPVTEEIPSYAQAKGMKPRKTFFKPETSEMFGALIAEKEETPQAEVLTKQPSQ